MVSLIDSFFHEFAFKSILFSFAHLGQEYKSALAALNKAVAGSSVDEFLESAENALEACGMILKKIDKKKDRLVVEFKKYIE